MTAFRLRRLAAPALIAAVAVVGLAAVPAQAISLKYVSVQVPVNPNSQGGTDALCPEDRHVTGGGIFSSGAYQQTLTNDSYPIDGADADTKPDDGWRATIDNHTSGSPNLTSLAICSKEMPHYRRKGFGSSEVVTTVECPNGTKPSGGGVSTDGTFAQSTRILTSRSFDSIDANLKPEGWVGYAEDPANAEIPSRVFVICVEKPKLHYRGLNFTVGPGAQAPGEVECHAAERLIGIGAATNSAVMAINTMYGLDGDDADPNPDDGAVAHIDNFLTFERTATVEAVCARDP